MWGKWELQHFWDVGWGGVGWGGVGWGGVGWGDGRGKGCESCDDMERR